MRYFIVRPFGTKNDIDFDRIDRELITPACEKAGFEGGTTGQFLEQGNIRSDMFEQLLVADLVIADISIHNANVFYELGIRHTFRDKRTFLIRSKGDEVPFDLKTDRYFSYHASDPAASLDTLTAALKATWISEDQDSPVFQLLPGLEPADAEKFQIVPNDFREEVEHAKASSDRARLQLLSAETEGFGWRVPGLRLIAHAQRSIGDLTGARISWKSIRTYDETDVESNTELGTIFQRLDDLTASNLALECALKDPGARRCQRAEIMALMGRNAKTRWIAEWTEIGPIEKRQVTALGSGHLKDSFEWYRKGFRQDRNHFYSGINALAMVTVITELAEAHPAEWQNGFESDEEADFKLSKLKERRNELAAAVKLSIESREAELDRKNESDIWTEISHADLVCLNSGKPSRVGIAYKKTLAAAGEFERDAARKQLILYQSLGVLPENVAAALENIPESVPQEKAEASVSPRVLLFTGHRVDGPGRESPRFPADRENFARNLIYEAVLAEKEQAQGDLVGISGGASGGDILFHEVCAELEIPTKMYLALPRNNYVATSVTDSGPEWVERFNHLYTKDQRKTLSQSGELPRWLKSKPNYSIWERSNLWMLHNALSISEENLTLIALWDGKPGDGPGGTEDMVRRAKERGAKFVHLDACRLIDEA